MILEMILDGKLYPAEQIVITAPEYKELRRKATKLRMELVQTLDRPDRERLEAYIEEMERVNCYVAEEYLKYGLTLGVRLMTEVEAVPYLRDVE